VSGLEDLAELRYRARLAQECADDAQGAYCEALKVELSRNRAQDVADALGVTRTGMYQTLRRANRRQWGTTEATPLTSGLTVDDYRWERQRQVDAVEGITRGYKGDEAQFYATGGRKPITYREWLEGSKQHA
jgi:hypothetical protein